MGRLDKYRKLPVFKIAEEILELAEVIAEAIKEDDKKEHFAAEIVSNAMIIQVKIAGAEGGSLYSLRMYNAVIIKLAVQDMMNAVICTEMFDIGEEDYVDLMREKVEEFRVEFVEWNWGIRFDTSTPEQEKLEDLMFDEDKFFDDLDDSDEDESE